MSASSVGRGPPSGAPASTAFPVASTGLANSALTGQIGFTKTQSYLVRRTSVGPPLAAFSVFRPLVSFAPFLRIRIRDALAHVGTVLKITQTVGKCC